MKQQSATVSFTQGQTTVTLVVPHETVEESAGFANQTLDWFCKVQPDGGHLFARYDPHALHTDEGAEEFSAFREEDLLDPMDRMARELARLTGQIPRQERKEARPVMLRLVGIGLLVIAGVLTICAIRIVLVMFAGG